MNKYLIIFFLSFGSLSLLTSQSTDIFVHTIEGRPIANVQMNPCFITDANGMVTIPNGEVITPFYTDTPNNGLDLRDAVMLQKHILGNDIFPNQQYWVLGDFNDSQGLTALDMVLLRRAILHIDDPISEWQFIEMQPDDYLGYKLGDVDDSALFPGDSHSGSADLFFWSNALAANEEVSIDVNLSNTSQTLIGMELQLNYDPAELDFHDVLYNGTDGAEVHLAEPTQGELIIHLINANLGTLSLDVVNNNIQGIIQLKFTPKQASLAKDLFSFSTELPSFVLNEECEKEIFVSDIDDMMTSNQEIDFVSPLKISPNPASERITLDFQLENSTDFAFSLYNIEGRKVLQKRNQKLIEIDQLTKGVYSYLFSTNQGRRTGKLLVVD